MKCRLSLRQFSKVVPADGRPFWNWSRSESRSKCDHLRKGTEKKGGDKPAPFKSTKALQKASLRREQSAVTGARRIFFSPDPRPRRRSSFLSAGIDCGLALDEWSGRPPALPPLPLPPRRPWRAPVMRSQTRRKGSVDSRPDDGVSHLRRCLMATSDNQPCLVSLAT